MQQDTDYAICHILLQLDNQAVFPQEFTAQFPPNFVDVVRTIFKRLFRVYAHIYHSHFKHVVHLKEEAHLNTCFKHFIYFVYVSCRPPPHPHMSGRGGITACICILFVGDLPH